MQLRTQRIKPAFNQTWDVMFKIKTLLNQLYLTNIHNENKSLKICIHELYKFVSSLSELLSNYIFNKYFPFQACLTDSGGQLWRWRILQEGVCRGQPAEQNLQTPKGRDECWLNINLMTLGNYQRIYKEFISDKGPGPSHFKWSRSRRMVHVINFLRTSYPH